MNRFLLIFSVYLFSLSSCDRTSKAVHTTTSTKPNTDSLAADSARKWRTDFNKGLGLPDLTNYPREVYRFTWWRPFGPSFAYQVEKLNSEQYLLTTSVFHASNNDSKLKNAKWRQGTQTFNDVTTVFPVAEISGTVSGKEWKRFKTLLYGSYYWSFEDPTPNDGILDGEFWTLESKALIPSSYDTIPKYHETNIHAPLKGSFTTACIYLGSLSGIGMPALLDKYYK